MRASYAHLKELYVDMGLSLRETAEMVDMPMSTVRNMLLASGVRMRKQGHPNGVLPYAEYAKVAYMYQELEMTIAEIGRRLGLAPDTVRNRLIQHGVERRPRHWRRAA